MKSNNYLLLRVRFIEDTDIISVSVSAPLLTYPDRLPPPIPRSDIIIFPADVECTFGEVDFWLFGPSFLECAEALRW